MPAQAGDRGFDVQISCAFNSEARATEFTKLGPILVLKARTNADLHMAADLRNAGKENHFVIVGEPDIDPLLRKGSRLRVKVNGADDFKPQTGELVNLALVACTRGVRTPCQPGRDGPADFHRERFLLSVHILVVARAHRRNPRGSTTH